MVGVRDGRLCLDSNSVVMSLQEEGLLPSRLRSDSAESSHKRQGLERLGYKLMRRVQKMLMKVGVHPNTPRMLFRYGGGGGYIRWLQKRTG